MVKMTEDMVRNKLGSFGYSFQQVETTLRVRFVLNGKHKLKELKLVHFRFDKSVGVVFNPPQLLAFPDERHVAKNRSEEGGGHDYLLFLKSRKDGKYEPVSGQEDPIFSVRQLGDPRLLRDK
jgi:hypothetical protein